MFKVDDIVKVKNTSNKMRVISVGNTLITCKYLNYSDNASFLRYKDDLELLQETEGKDVMFKVGDLVKMKSSPSKMRVVSVKGDTVTCGHLNCEGTYLCYKDDLELLQEAEGKDVMFKVGDLVLTKEKGYLRLITEIKQPIIICRCLLEDGRLDSMHHEYHQDYLEPLTKEEETNNFKVGDVVKLASGGPDMTVYDTSTDGKEILVKWFDEEHLPGHKKYTECKKASFSSNSLVKVKKGN